MIPFLDLHKINDRFRDQFHEILSESLKESQFILGKSVTKFENEFSDYCGAKYCVGTGNGLDALTLILKGFIELGQLNEGDKVLVPANTFIATILSVIHSGLIPVFTEPDRDSYNISSKAIKSILNEEIKAIIVVHLYGQLADVETIKKMVDEKNILLIEDAAQAHGASCEMGRAGNLADAGAFSFYPSKNLGALGDGGAVVTNDLELINVVRKLSNYGSEKKYQNKIVGFNSRLDGLQASFLSIKLKSLNKDNERRQEIAKMYLREIKNSKIKLPSYNNSNDHVFYAFVVEVEDRVQFSQYLDRNEIGWLVHYPIPPHKQEAMKVYSKLNLPITEKIHQRVISLPISPIMTNAEVKSVIDALNTY
jgi:dTDP-4-amino-4,6-dideoxygalactose transaminase